MGEKKPDPMEQLQRLQSWLSGLHRDSHSSRTLNHLTPQEADAALLVAESIIRAEPPKSRSIATTVIAHLDPTYGEWGKVPVGREEIPLWEKFRFSPDRAFQWIEADLSLEDVPNWHEWDSPKSVVRWKETKIPPRECVLWQSFGIDPTLAEKWHKASIGYPIKEASIWLKAFPDLNVRNTHVLMLTFENVSDAAPWVNLGIPAVQTQTWKMKNYTPGQALIKISHNVSAFDAPYILPHLALPGRQWKKICGVATGLGWELLSVDQGWDNEEKVTIFRRGNKKACLRLQNRRFVEGWENTHSRYRNFSTLTKNVLQ